MELTHLLMTFVVTFISLLNSSTVSNEIIQSSEKHAEKGQSVELHVQEHVDETAFDGLEWIKDNNKDVVVSYDFETKSVKSYKDRVVFNTGNYSLTLKNIQEADSGIYRARVTGERDITIGLYNVTVGTSSHGSTTGSDSRTWIIFLLLLGAIMI